MIFHASGDGAVAGRCCRLCGGDACLRALGDTYSDGVQESCDRLLYDCFGVTVSGIKTTSKNLEVSSSSYPYPTK
jgi:hypothetical protein